MASTVAMYTALSGLNAASRNLDVIGNNIANVNTAGFKSARVQFADNFYQTLRGGSAPTDSDGGSNPVQIGLGVSIGGVARSFAQGSLSVTGEAGDLALEGPGFFVVNQGPNRFYTRGGSFRLDAGNNLVTASGHVLQGYLANDDFTLPDGGPLSPISVPLGGRAITEASTYARLVGNLNSTGSVADNGSIITIGGSATAGLRVVAGATPAPGAGEQIVSASLLTDIEDPATAVGSGTRLFAVDQIIEIRGAKRGTATIESQRFTVEATSTVDDLLTFLSQALGIQGGTANPDGNTPGVTIDPTTGIATVVGNIGTASDLSIGSSSIRLLSSAGMFIRSPFTTAETTAATGESVRTQFVGYDSLGNEVVVNMTMALLSKNASGGTTWQYFVDSPDDGDLSTPMGSGTVSFDDQGQLVDTTPISVSMERDEAGAVSPFSFEIRLASGNSGVTALATASQLLPAQVDGLPPGTLESFAVSRDGVVVGTFSNGAVRPLARLALATFVNAAGLIDAGSNLFQEGINSGVAAVIPAGSASVGDVIEGSLELSNVDLSQEFINLITASTAFSASSRVITTTDQLYQQLLALGR